MGGGLLATFQPGLDEAKLSASGRIVFRGVARAVLDGTLPAAEPARSAALAGLVERIDGVVAALAPHAQAELSQLLAVLASGAGRQLVAGLARPWEDAPVSDVQAALQGMRTSSISLKQQAYQALHDIVGGAYFSDPGTWAALGYPGPLKI